MTRAQILTRLRKEIRDGDSVQFSDAELEDLINQAYGLIQKEIFKVAPEAHVAWDTIDTEANESWYPLPPSFALLHVGIKLSAADTMWMPLTKANSTDIEPHQVFSGAVAITPSAGGGMKYARKGQYIGIFPAPTVAVSAGIRIVHNPIMALAEDDETPKIKTPLHTGIMWWAKILALGETDEQTTMTEKRLSELLTDLSSWYDVTQDAPDRLKVQR